MIATDSLSVDGGNISIDTNTLVALDNSDITANALARFGGRVTIAADGIFGTEFRTTLTPESDITASSALGSQFLGVVQLQTPNLDTAGQGFRTVEAETTEPISVTDRCSDVARSRSTFAIATRRSNPEEIERSRTMRFPLVAPHDRGIGTVDRATYLTEDRGPEEASGWVQRADGVTLVGGVVRSPRLPTSCVAGDAAG